MTFADKYCHYLAFAVLLLAASACQAHPLEDAAHQALDLCQRLVPEQSIEDCASVMQGRSPEHTAARRAVRALILLRTEFIYTCKESPREWSCPDRADWYIGSGMSRVLNGPVQYQ